MGSIMSLDGDPSTEAMYDCLLDHVLQDISKSFSCQLPEFNLQEVPELPRDFSNASTLSTEESDQLHKLFVDGNVELQHTMANYFFNAYPIVCDVAVDVAARLLGAKAGNLFEVFMLIGGYGDLGPGSYHAWLYLRGKQSQCGVYLDLTYIQFLRDNMTTESVTMHDGTVKTMLSWEDLKAQVSQSPETVRYPKPIVLCSEAEFDLWLPHSMARVQYI